jgi:hypothetical protein
MIWARLSEIFCAKRESSLHWRQLPAHYSSRVFKVLQRIAN